MGILPGATFTVRPSLVLSPIFGALLHGTLAVGDSQTLQRRTRNGITELSQREPPVFGRAAITLGIGPHSNYVVGLLLDIEPTYCPNTQKELSLLYLLIFTLGTLAIAGIGHRHVSVCLSVCHKSVFY